jgi:uncharacterized membrane protein
MAAIICESFGKLCHALGDVICLPCKACGIGCEAIMDALKSPFSLYILVAVGLNAAPIYMGIRTLPDLGGGCGEATSWLIVNGAICLIHIVAAFYMIHKIQEDRRTQSLGVVTQDLAKADHLETGGHSQYNTLPAAKPMGGMGLGHARENPDHQSSWGRIKHVLCYDVGVAIYIVIMVFWLCWMAMSIPRYASIGSDGCSDIGSRLLTSMICGYFFMTLGAFAFMCSICCLQPWNS